MLTLLPCGPHSDPHYNRDVYDSSVMRVPMSFLGSQCCVRAIEEKNRDVSWVEAGHPLGYT